MLASHSLLFAALASASVLAGAATAHADVVSYSSTVSSHAAPSSFAPALTQFDPSLGTLTGATISFALTLTPSGTAVDLGAPAGTPFTATTTGVSYSLSDPYGVTNSQSYDFTGNPLYTGTGVANGTFFNVQSVTFPSVSFSDSSAVPLAHLADFTGSGTFAPSFNDANLLSGGGSGGGQGFGTALSIGGSETVTYTFTPTPEPASLSVIGLSTIGLLLRRRQR